MLNRCSPSPAGSAGRCACKLRLPAAFAHSCEAAGPHSLWVKLGARGNGKCTNETLAAAVPPPCRVTKGATEEQAVGDSSTPGGSGAATGGKAKRGRRPRSDPRKMLNADGDPLNSDPGSLGK
jgi:hypothetical protein